MKGAIEMNTIINKTAAVKTYSNESCSSVSGISENVFNEVRYTYKVRKQKENVSGTEFTQKICRNSSGSNTEQDTKNFYQIQTDTTDNFVTIKFFLPKTAKTKLILQNPYKTEGIFLINKK